MTHNDEVGYLTTAFNRLIATLRQELDARQAAEADLRQLNLTLEERVAKRTHELETLNQLNAASNEAGNSQTLFNLPAGANPEGFTGAIRFPAADHRYHRRADNCALAAADHLPEEWKSKLLAHPGRGGLGGGICSNITIRC